MKILIIADIHGDYVKLGKILDSAKNSFDLVICPGDFTDMFKTPASFSQIDIANLVLQKLLLLNKPLFCVPGNHDPYEILDLFDEYGTNLHNKIKNFGGVSFIGFGGAPTPFNTIIEPPESETKKTLKSLGEKIKNSFILVVHNPPKGTNLDLLKSGEHVGSQAIRSFILEKKPILALSAHIHERKGAEKLGQTTLFFPGPAFSGFYGIVEIEKKKTKCTIKKI